LKHIKEDGYEFWPARQLCKVLGYQEYRNFLPVIEKAKKSCTNSGQLVDNHFVDINEMVDYAVFQNHGYMGLSDELRAKEIHNKKGLKKTQQILDHMGSTELAANLFRATQTEEKLKRDNIKEKEEANKTHFNVGKKVRQTIKELGGTMPEDLPTVESIKKIEKEENKKLT
jgi:DNA-damage-inducible protein D